jgi:hypothetical protein
MKSKKQHKTTNKQLSQDMGFLVKEVLIIKDYIRDVISPTLQSTMSMFESYLNYRGDTEQLIKFMEKEINNAKETENRESKEGKKKQTKGSRVTKTNSQNGKGI